MRGRNPSLKHGDPMMINQHWTVKYINPNMVELINNETGDSIKITVAHLYSLAAIVEEVKRTYGESQRLLSI